VTGSAADRAAADQAALGAAKRQLRAAVLLRRASRAVEERTADDESRFAVLVAALSDRLPDTVAAYLSTDEEPDTLRLVSWLAARRVRVLLPLLTDGSGHRLAEPAWAAYEGPEALRVGPLGLLEPTTTPLPARQLPEAELVVCPGLAANRHGDRLGRGGGWYDRALLHAGQSTPVVVLLNRDEVFDAIPTQPWDRRVDQLATPDGIVDCEPPYAG
jgi:5-formyltetrahydrofolate cyclo-ligase